MQFYLIPCCLFWNRDASIFQNIFVANISVSFPPCCTDFSDVLGFVTNTVFRKFLLLKLCDWNETVRESLSFV
jgi:hypothetical protein